MRYEFRIPLLFVFFLLFCVPRAAAADWDPVTDAEKNMTSNPLDPGSGALVLFKRGNMEVLRANTSLWETKIVTYTRIKILTDAGRDAANVELEAPKYLRYTKIEGRTILPSGRDHSSRYLEGLPRGGLPVRKLRHADHQLCIFLGAARSHHRISDRAIRGLVLSRRPGFLTRAAWRLCSLP